MSSLVLDTAIGLVFTFAVLSAITSLLTEFVSRWLGLRAEYLLRGIRSLLEEKNNFSLTPVRDALKRRKSESAARKTEAQSKQSVSGDHDEASQKLPVKLNPLKINSNYAQMIVSSPFYVRTAQAQTRTALKAGNQKLTPKERRGLPSYLSSRSFARALLAIILDVRPAAGEKNKIPDGEFSREKPIPASQREQIRTSIESLQEPLKTPVMTFFDEAEGNVTAFRKAIEEWYDDEMARVSGWYKKHVRGISLILAAILVVAFNVNAVQLSRALYTDQALREAVVTQASSAANCGTKELPDCLRDLRQEVVKAQASGLPIGWGSGFTLKLGCVEGADPEAHACAPGFWGLVYDVLLLVLGWLLMVLATLPGARFWFDLLARLGSLRESGPKPKTT